MKKIKNLKYLIVILFFAFTSLTYGQMLGPEDPGGEPIGPPLGGAAPVGDGVVLLIVLGSAYAVIKSKGFSLGKTES